MRFINLLTKVDNHNDRLRRAAAVNTHGRRDGILLAQPVCGARRMSSARMPSALADRCTRLCPALSAPGSAGQRGPPGNVTAALNDRLAASRRWQYARTLVYRLCFPVRLRCPANVLGKNAFVPRRPLHTLMPRFICHRQRGETRPARFVTAR